VRTNLDVLNANNSCTRPAATCTRRYNYLISQLRLKGSGGSLGEEGFDAIQPSAL